MKHKMYLKMTLLLASLATGIQLAAQTVSPDFIVTIRNLSHPNAEAVVRASDTKISAKPSDQLEIIWRLSADSPIAQSMPNVSKIECKDVTLLAQLEKGPTATLAKVKMSEDPSCVKVIFKADDYKQLLNTHKPGLLSFEEGTKIYLKFGEMIVHDGDGQSALVSVPERQLHVGITLN